MKICVIGTGYVGLVSGACIAETGNQVTCVDVDEKKILALSKGVIPIYEPGLDLIVAKNVSEGRLTFTTNLEKAVNSSQICFIAVGTPPNEDGSADLSHVLKVAEDIAKTAKGTIVVGTKSTVPVGTGDKIEEVLRKNTKNKFVVFSNPEFLKEGDAINDFMKPDRIIIGVNDDSITPLLKELYSPFTRQKDRLIFMSRKSAELTKYAANAMLATRISFMNEISNLCEKVGANVNDVRLGIGSDPRIGSAFLFPGIGYGGSCFPKDVKALEKTARDYNCELKVVSATEQANHKQKSMLFEKIVTHFGNKQNLKKLKIAVWGLAFKAKTDDIRESPALAVIDKLIECGVKVSVYDPQATKNVKAVYGDKLDYANQVYGTLENADALVIATEWNEFRSPDYDKIKSLLKKPVIFDGRNLLNMGQLKQLDFVYYGVGI